MHVLLHEHGLPSDIVEIVRGFYSDVFGRVVGATSSFGMTCGVKQGCPASTVLFGLFFDQVVKYISRHLPYSPETAA